MKPLKTIEELRSWMISLHPDIQITDEIIIWVTCHYKAKYMLETLTQSELASMLLKGIPQINSWQFLEEVLTMPTMDDDIALINSLEIQVIAANLLGQYKLAATLKEKIDELCWYDDH